MNFDGIVIGIGSFLVIGILHPAVVKGEYYFGKKIWPLFLLGGLVAIGGALFLEETLWSGLAGVTGFSLLWSIRELYEQEERVAKGWYPANPRRTAQTEPPK